MLRPYSYSKEIILAFWFAAVLTAVVWLISGWVPVVIEMIRFGSVAALTVFVLRLLIRLGFRLNMFREDRRIKKIMFEQGVTPELLSIVKRRADKSRTPGQKAEAQLVLASFLSEGCCFERCFEVLSEIDPRELCESSKEEYFNIYVYTNLMAGDTAAALRIYDSSRLFFDRARLRNSAMPVLHTMGALEYAMGDYVKAENYFTQALAYAVGKSSRCDCEMFLSLCYLKTGRIQYAVSAAKNAARDAATVYQRRSIEGLRMQLEEQVRERSNLSGKETAIC
ncbi:MAG: hypothetical protein IKN17_03175 [Ruminococcus sp.]|nr:hypothetical protein [Ruminococcus sp.]